jgi:hypothetical protein
VKVKARVGEHSLGTEILEAAAWHTWVPPYSPPWSSLTRNKGTPAADCRCHLHLLHTTPSSPQYRYPRILCTSALVRGRLVASHPTTMDPLELAKVFVKTVVRMFYETDHIVVVDALVFHGAYV